MTPKFYGMLWIAFAAIILGTLVAGAMNLMAVVVFGFIAFGMVWAGMICVLPGMFGHNAKKYEPAAEMPAKANVTVFEFATPVDMVYKKAA